jgi:16S rRNA (cytidine1402-2'-O)-methyltransferase
MDTSGKLSIVATPIGNLEDITLRALRVLKEAAVVYCEDTRVTKKLLDKYEIRTLTRRLDANTEGRTAAEVIGRLAAGEIIAYCTDAGTPCISDPGYRLVAAVREAGFTIEAVPGPSALAAALSIAGVPADSFHFLGFLPHKKGRQTLLKWIAEEEGTIVLFESSHRIEKLLGELGATVPEREIVIVREVTKRFEEVQTGTASILASLLEGHREHAKGEFVVIIAPC